MNLDPEGHTGTYLARPLDRDLGRRDPAYCRDRHTADVDLQLTASFILNCLRG